MSGHSPGPWELRFEPYPDGVITDRMGRHIAKMLPGTPETAANAHRLKAAPDLLAACEAMYDQTIETDDVHRMMRAAIAKARGEVTP